MGIDAIVITVGAVLIIMIVGIAYGTVKDLL